MTIINNVSHEDYPPLDKPTDHGLLDIKENQLKIEQAFRLLAEAGVGCIGWEGIALVNREPTPDNDCHAGLVFDDGLNGHYERILRGLGRKTGFISDNTVEVGEFKEVVLFITLP